ncbi:MAG: hypothetical protein DMF82_10830 [Acidobacteria bacterium]|nr:MAG: hypothetical protein DMF82_10830 [Acidobacteriota bacterium]
MGPRAVGLAAAVGAALSLGQATASHVPPEAAAAGYVGATRCAECHKAMAAKWRSGRHSRMLQPASASSVLGDFSRGRQELRARRYSLRTEGGGFFITEGELDGGPRERRVDYTLGSRRVQHYLTTLDDGRIVVLPPSWDVGRQEWFHNMEIVDPEETPETRVQVWNANCVGCHVSQEQKRYEPATRRYRTEWMDFGTSCEVCHGPGRGHGADASGVVRPERLGAERSTMVCAQCHSLRDVNAPGFRAGDDYFDHFMPILEYAQKVDKDPAYWADGRPRRFSNDALGFWQSRCFLEGSATCVTCHLDPHVPDVDRNPQLAPSNNGLCLGCHEPIAARPAAHTHHRADGPGSSCVECHMPRTVFSIKARIRDHTLSVPAPENTTRFGIPNACNAGAAGARPSAPLPTRRGLRRRAPERAVRRSGAARSRRARGRAAPGARQRRRLPAAVRRFPRPRGPRRRVAGGAPVVESGGGADARRAETRRGGRGPHRGPRRPAPHRAGGRGFRPHERRHRAAAGSGRGAAGGSEA